MLLIIIIGIAILSVVLALFSLSRQKKMGEIKRAKKELKRSKVIFYPAPQSHKRQHEG